MRRKRLRALSLVLTAVMVVSIVNPGITAFATAADDAVEQQMVDVVEDVTTTEEQIQDESVVVKEEKEIEVQKKTFNSAASLATIMPDENLRKAVAKAVKGSESASMTIGDLEAFAGELTFTNTAIVNIAGLGAATSATKIDISALTKVTAIPKEEFMECTFTEFRMPTSIKTIGEKAFAKCGSLEKFYTGSSENTLPAGLTSVGQHAFMDNTSLTAVVIPNFTADAGVLESSVGVFSGCTKLTSITIGKDVTHLPVDAFRFAGSHESCAGVQINIATGSNLDQILNNAFSSAKLATTTLDLSMCNKLTAIEAGAFRAVTGLSTVKLPGSLTSVSGTLTFGEYAFAETTLTSLYPVSISNPSSIYLPDYTAPKIGSGVFYGNTTVTAVSLCASLIEIPDHMFDGCTALETVTQRGSSAVTLIGDCAFRSTAISNLNFMENMPKLRQIGRQTHDMYPTNKTQFTSLPAGAKPEGNKKLDTTVITQKKYDNKYVGSEVFTDCYKLTSITIPATVEVIGNRAFYFNSSLYNTTLGTTANEELENGMSVSDLINMVYDKRSEANSIVTTITWKTASGTAGKTRKIYPEAFSGNMNVTTVVLPQNSGESLSIGAFAFYDNWKLKTVGVASTTTNALPATVSEIGRGAFMQCISIPKVVVQGNPSLDIQTFEECWSLTNATLPTTVTVIPKHFFAGCPLTSFAFNQMPNLTTIDTLAFVGHQMETVDLSNCTKLTELGGGSLALLDNVKKDTSYANQYTVMCYVNSYNTTMRKVVLPDSLTGALHLNTSAFAYQVYFDTMGRKSATTQGVVTIPSYVQASAGKGIFSSTSVSKVVWEADAIATGNQWTILPENTFEGCANVTDVRNVLPKYVKEIRKRAFALSGITSADLSEYANLEKISSGALDYASQFEGAFAECKYLTTVSLPDAGKSIVVDRQSFKASAVLSNVNLGAAISLGDNAFENCTGLQTLDLKKVQTVGNNTFKGCTALTMTGKKMSDSVVSIGNNAYEGTTALGEVTFGTGLKTIGSSAFKDSGMTKVNFGYAKELNKIGNNAFENTKLTTFAIAGTEVTSIPVSMLWKNALLTGASFGEEVQYIDSNALAGCPKFKNFDFYASTTVSQNVFQMTYSENGQTISTGKNNGQSNASTNLISVTVNTPEQTLVPIGREVAFPYYVNEEGTSNIQYLRVYDDNNATDLSVDQYFSVRSKTKSVNGYYKVTKSDDENGKYQIGKPYFTNLDKADVITLANNKKVDSVKVTGLKPSEAGRDLKFEIYADITFNCNDRNVTIQSTSFDATYNVKVVDADTTAQVFKDQKLETPLSTDAVNHIQVKDGTKGAALYYYDLFDKIDTGSKPNDYNVTVVTDNPNVLYPAETTSTKPQTTYVTKASTTNASGVTTTNQYNKKFYLIPVGIGTATITVYPNLYDEAAREKYKRVYTFTVGSDIQSITLAIPSEVNGKINPGATFSVFSKYKNYFGQECTVADMSTFKQYTNRNIVFTSSDPDYVSVDQMGNVTILKADPNAKQVKITATAETAYEGRYVTAITVLNVSYPNIKTNENMADPASGATIAVTRVSKKDLEGEVKFVQPADPKATDIVIPDTVVVNGVQYKVTAIEKNLFKNNKKLKTVVIGGYVKSIDKSAFSGCTALKKVTIGNAVEKIDEKAFYNCKNLTTVTLSSKSKLTTIGKSAFEKCGKLNKITIPKTIKTIDSKAFYNCKKLKTVSINSSAKLESIGSNAFGNCVKLTKINLPKSLRTVGKKAFYNCKVLKTITIYSTVLSSVGQDAFKGIHKKATIKVPKKKLAAYKTLLAGKGQKSTVKIKKK